MRNRFSKHKDYLEGSSLLHEIDWHYLEIQAYFEDASFFSGVKRIRGEVNRFWVLDSVKPIPTMLAQKLTTLANREYPPHQLRHLVTGYPL